MSRDLLVALVMSLACSLKVAARQEIGCAPLSPLEYVGVPADVRTMEFRVVRANSQVVEAIVGEYPDRKLWISRDAGYHWQPSSEAKGDWRGLVVASGSSRSRVIYVLRENGRKLLRSLDGGRAWEGAALQVQGIDQALEKVELAIGGVAEDGQSLYASFQTAKVSEAAQSDTEWRHLSGVYVSRDRGDTWSFFSSSLVVGSPVAADNYEGSLFFGVASTGLVKSTDGGKTWGAVGEQQMLATPVALQGRVAAMRKLQQTGESIPDYLQKGVAVEIYQIEVDSRTRSVLVVSNRGLLISRDLGESWCISEVGANVLDLINGLAVSETNNEDVYVSTRAATHRRSSLYFSNDAGRHFRAIYSAAGTPSSHRADQR